MRCGCWERNQCGSAYSMRRAAIHSTIPSAVSSWKQRRATPKTCRLFAPKLINFSANSLLTHFTCRWGLGRTLTIDWCSPPAPRLPHRALVTITKICPMPWCAIQYLRGFNKSKPLRPAKVVIPNFRAHQMPFDSGSFSKVSVRRLMSRAICRVEENAAIARPDFVKILPLPQK